jgi:hypothetical protein
MERILWQVMAGEECPGNAKHAKTVPGHHCGAVNDLLALRVAQIAQR